MAIEWHTMEAKEQLLAAPVAASKHTVSQFLLHIFGTPPKMWQLVREKTVFDLRNNES